MAYKRGCISKDPPSALYILVAITPLFYCTIPYLSVVVPKPKLCIHQLTELVPYYQFTALFVRSFPAYCTLLGLIPTRKKTAVDCLFPDLVLPSRFWACSGNPIVAVSSHCLIALDPDRYCHCDFSSHRSVRTAKWHPLVQSKMRMVTVRTILVPTKTRL